MPDLSTMMLVGAVEAETGKGSTVTSRMLGIFYLIWWVRAEGGNKYGQHGCLTAVTTLLVSNMDSMAAVTKLSVSNMEQCSCTIFQCTANVQQYFSTSLSLTCLSKQPTERKTKFSIKIAM